MVSQFDSLMAQIEACRLCEGKLVDGVRPVVQASPKAKILIVGQAPGSKVHRSGVPFDDASGDRLREWLGIPKEIFYDPERVAIVPMGFCYPGKGTSGDLPPRRECAPAWRESLLQELPNIELTLLIGQYAQRYHLGSQFQSVTENVRGWQKFWPSIVPLPHPSPRNNVWLKRNPWFEEELLPVLKAKISEVLSGNKS